MVKDVLIISSERSGTHFLIDTIHRNFSSYKQYSRIDVPPTGDQKTFEYFFKNFEYGKGRIIKNHHQWEFYKPIWNEIKNKFYVFYMLRDGKDVMVSLHYYFNKAPHPFFPATKTVGDLMRKDPKQYVFDICYSKIRLNNMVQRWAYHVTKWSEIKEINLLKYSELHNDYINTVKNKIVPILKEVPVFPLNYPSLKDGTGISPRKGIVGDWKNHFAKDDEEYFYREVDKINSKLYKDKGRLQL